MSSSQKEPVDNRQKILLAAEELFSAQGFVATSVREIVSKAEVTAPVLYYYFGSKDELLTTLVSERFTEHMTRLEPMLEKTKTVEEVFLAWCSSLVEETVARPTTLRLILGALWGPPVQHLQYTVFQFHMRVRELFNESLLRCDPSIPLERVNYALMTLNGLINSLLFPVLQLGVPVHQSELIETVVPRTIAVLYDGEPVPTRTLDALSSQMQNVLSAHAENPTPEKA